MLSSTKRVAELVSICVGHTYQCLLIGEEKLHSTQNELRAGLEKQPDDLISHFPTQMVHKCSSRLTVIGRISSSHHLHFKGVRKYLALFCCLHHMLRDTPGISWFSPDICRSQKCRALEMDLTVFLHSFSPVKKNKYLHCSPVQCIGPVAMEGKSALRGLQGSQDKSYYTEKSYSET